MIALEIVDVDYEAPYGVVYCSDKRGNMYNFPVSEKEAKVLSLLINSAYIHGNSIHDFVVDVMNAAELDIEYILIEKKDSVFATVYVKFQETLKHFSLFIPDAFILALSTHSKVYVKDNIDFMKIDDLLWSNFIRKLV